MGPRWFVNLMRVLAVIIILAILTFTIAEFIGLLDLKDRPVNNNAEIIYMMSPPFLMLSFISPEEKSYSARAGMRSNDCSDIINFHFTIDVREVFFNHFGYSFCVFQRI